MWFWKTVYWIYVALMSIAVGAGVEMLGEYFFGHRELVALVATCAALLALFEIAGGHIMLGFIDGVRGYHYGQARPKVQPLSPINQMMWEELHKPRQ
jgi:hypothetical protein